MLNKKTPPLTLTIIIVVLAIIMLSMIIWDKKIESMPSPITTEQPTQISSSDEAADWQVYSNDQYGYEVRLPSEYQHNDITDELIKASEKSMGGLKEPEHIVVFGADVQTFNFPDDLISENYMFNVRVFQDLSVENFLGLPISDDDIIFSEKEIDGKVWISKEVISDSSEFYNSKGSITYAVEKNNLTYSISLSSKLTTNKNLTEKILSTFKFIN